jgi:hypothetical protein
MRIWFIDPLFGADSWPELTHDAPVGLQLAVWETFVCSGLISTIRTVLQLYDGPMAHISAWLRPSAGSFTELHSEHYQIPAAVPVNVSADLIVD